MANAMADIGTEDIQERLEQRFKRMKKLQHEIIKLKEELDTKEAEMFKLKFQQYQDNKYCFDLSATEVVRYSRQMLLPQVSISGQVSLKRSKVLIVGMGGLGCPCAMYLAAAGVGEITIIDHDEIDLTNLHRQTLYDEKDVGSPKIMSAYNRLRSINSGIKIIPIHTHANSNTFEELFQNRVFDVVVDGSDNVATRYLLNDACVLNKIPLVSGSALQMEGHLTVYNYDDGPCYRCVFPTPPPPEAVTSCGDGGVLGPVPGIIGTLQALETVKILTKQTGVLSRRLLTFDGCESVFRNIKLRGRNARCKICGIEPEITQLIDYEAFCGSRAHDKIVNINVLPITDNVCIEEIPHRPDTLILDVRPTVEFAMCNLENNTFNFPYNYIKKGKDIDKLRKKIEEYYADSGREVFVICRRGNDSQRAITELKEIFCDLDMKFYNVKGGLYAYSRRVDPSFPIY